MDECPAEVGGQTNQDRANEDQEPNRQAPRATAGIDLGTEGRHDQQRAGSSPDPTVKEEAAG